MTYQSIFNKATNKYGLFRFLWWRYIDDIFFLWEHGENKLKSFIDKIDKVHPTIKFTAE